ncbi:zinc ribbon domain-containing protein [Brevibacillus laterosporus]|uniref:zinc ribbon domain-containing protein n=1 Tax=Brevibacillus laterosporus TaxID=1465 RepID=UPI00215C163B|nr:zinc ribbon domain-containing protein [Brevibacillus laterosporus]MCR8995935.1 zinc ribbon domain-containing protein [Brevibacillus laterosporus]
MKKRNKQQTVSNRAKYPLTGISFCAKCGGAMVCQKKTSEWRGKRYTSRYYRCSSTQNYGDRKCTQNGINAEKLEKTIYDDLLEEFTKIKEGKYVIDNEIEVRSHKERLEKLNKEREQLKKKQVQVVMNMDLFDDEGSTEILLGLKQKIQTLDEQIFITKRQIIESENHDKNVSKVKDVIESMKAIDLEDLGALKVLFHEVIEEVRIFDKQTIESIQYKYSFV